MARDWAKAFLQQYRKNGNVTVSAQSAKIDRTTVYKRRDVDKEFADAMDAAHEEAGDLLEFEARRRAHDGTEEPVFGRVGKDEDGQIGTVRKYSDTLMIFLLKGAKPEKYKERKDVTSGGKPLNSLVLMGVEELTEAEIDERLAGAQSGEAAPGVPA